ncbi:uncharacterized protein [Drosophila bipectinata]|uniref:uncharacterized protein n=1 Tax=Drosophila bipectinata TaxID=42026 RepID=UPI0038B346AD
MQGNRDVFAFRSTSEPPFCRARCSMRPSPMMAKASVNQGYPSEDRAPTNFVRWPASRPSVVTFCQVPYCKYRQPQAPAPTAMALDEEHQGSVSNYSPMNDLQDHNQEQHGYNRTPPCSVAESGLNQRCPQMGRQNPDPQQCPACRKNQSDSQQDDDTCCEPEAESQEDCCPKPCEEPKPKRCRRRRKPRCCYVVTHEQGIQTDDTESESKESQTPEPEIFEIREITMQETEVTHRTGEKEIEITEQQSVTKFPLSGQVVTEVQQITKAGKVPITGEENVTESGKWNTRVEDAKSTAAILASTEDVLNSLNTTLEPNVVESLKFGLRSKTSSIPVSSSTTPARRRSNSFVNNQKVVRPQDYPDMKKVKVTSDTTAHITGPQQRDNPVSVPQRRPSATRRRRPSAGSHMIMVSAEEHLPATSQDTEPEKPPNEVRKSTLQVVTTKRKEAALLMPDSEGKMTEVAAVVENKVTELHERKEKPPPKRKRPEPKTKFCYPSNDLITRMERPPLRNHCCIPCGGCPYSCSCSSYYSPCSRCEQIYGFGGHCAQYFNYL